MRPKVLLIGAVALLIAYQVWSTHTSEPATISPPIQSTPPTATATATPRGTATPTPSVPPGLLLSTGRAKRQATVNGSGFGFAPHEVIRLERENPDGKPKTLGTGKADKQGNFSGITFKVEDAWPENAREIRAVGQSSGRSASAQLIIEAGSPGAQPSTYFGKPLTAVNFSGGGFKPGESVTVYFDTLASGALGRFTADQSGIVHVSGVKVPMAAEGQHAFLLVGQHSAAPVRVPFSVLSFAPWLGLSDYTPQPERTISVTGHDFAPGEKVALFLDQASGQPLAEGVADAKGVAQLKSAFAVPYDRRGKVAVVAVGSISQTPVEATMTVRPYTPTLDLSAYAGPPGSTFVAKGHGFAHNELVTIRLGPGSGPNSAVSATAQTDARGDLQSVPIQIPSRAGGGKITVSVEGAHSQVPTSTTFAVLPLAPWISPNPAAGPSGKAIAFDGGGFEPGERVDIALAADAGGARTSARADKSGNLHRAGSLTVPKDATGRVSLQATGDASGAKASAVYTVMGGG